MPAAANRRVPLDENPALVGFALAVWAGLVAGLTLALGGFDDPRPMHNGWVRLLTLGLTAAALAWAFHVGREVVARRLQLGVAISLVLHTLLAVGLSQTSLLPLAELAAEPAPDPTTARPSIDPPEVVVVERRPPDARPEFDRPVASATPQLKTNAPTVERTAPQFAETSQTPDALPTPEPRSTPLEVDLTRPRLPRTQKGDSPGRASRRNLVAGRIEPTPQQLAVLEATLDPKTEETPKPTLSAATRVEQSKSLDQLTAPSPVEPSEDRERSTLDLLRPRRARQAPELAAAPSRSRPLETPLIVSAALSPAASPELQSPSETDPMKPRALIAEAGARRELLQPEVVAAAEPRPAGEPLRAEPSPLLAVRRPRPDSPLQPVQLPSSSDRAADANRAARLAQSRALSLPDLVATPMAETPTPRAPRLALSRGRGGFAGTSRSRNAALGRMAAPQFADSRVAGAASRPTASQENPGSERSPSTRLERPRSRAADNEARSTIPANAERAAEVAGASDPGEKNQTTAASESIRNAAAPVAEVTAAAGMQPVDRGVPRTLPERGEARGAAGGQPRLSLTPTRRPVRSAAPAAGLASASPLPSPKLAASLPPPSAASPETAGPGGPPSARSSKISGPRAAFSASAPRASGLPASESISPPPAPAAGSPSPPAAPLRLAMRSDAGLPAASSNKSGGRPAGGRAVLTPQPLGVGGLASVASKSLGLPKSLVDESPLITDPPGASVLPGSGGRSSIAGDARRPAAAFDNRGRRLDEGLSGGAGQPAPKTEAAIELGLRFVAGLQQSDGRWSFASLGGLPVPREEVPNVRADAAATGLALLSLLGAGYDHFGGDYQASVERGLDYLVAVQKRSGELFPEDRPPTARDGARRDNPTAAWGVARFYSHGIATIALCEAFGMTGDEKLREPAQRALDHIARSQVDRLGGWRYTPGVNADLSVSGWQMMALKSGELAGLRVDPKVYNGVRLFVERCRERAGNRARFCYNPTAPPNDPRTRHGLKPGTVMTSVGMLVRLYLGEDPNSDASRHGADHLLANLPQVGDGPARTSTLGNPLRDTYYWYYATQVMYHMRGDYWQAWSDTLRPLLVESQTSEGPLAGSWNPLGPAPDKWATFGGRLYVTTMNLLSLEVSYRHLPLYGEVGPAAGGE